MSGHFQPAHRLTSPAETRVSGNPTALLKALAPLQSFDQLKRPEIRPLSPLDRAPGWFFEPPTPLKMVKINGY